MQLLSGDARRAVFAPLDDGALRSEAVVRRVGSAVALGLLADGEQLPTEADLATMLNVSTVTLREALAELRKLGLVETRRGRGGGSFVRARDDALEGLAEARLAGLGTPDLRELGDVHGAVAAMAAWASPSSRRSVVPSPASRAAASSASASSRARTKLPPPRPRRVSTRPSSRSSASASRRVTVETLSMVASSVSAGSCSASPRRPSAIALPTRRTTASLRRAPSSRGANTARRASPLSICTRALPVARLAGQCSTATARR